MWRHGALALLVVGCGASGNNGGDSRDLAAPGGDDAAAFAGGDGGRDGAAGPAPDLAPPATAFVYVSGYAPTIARYTLDGSTGALTARGATPATGSPSFLAVDPARRHLYAVDEANSKVESFAIDPQSGALTHLGSDAASGGSGPAHLSVDGSGKWVLVANYTSGDLAVLPIGADGSAGAPTTTLHAGGNAHQLLTDASNHFAFAPCLMSNYVAQYAFDAAGGGLAPATPPTVPAASAGAGPRHLALHPNARYAYLIEESDSMMTAYSLDGAGHLAYLQRLSTRAAGASGANTGAEVQVHPSGKFLYGSNRGDDDIAVFALGSDGKMTAIAHTKTGGQTPRHFSLDPAGRFLLVANQGSGDVHVFAVDASTGTLSAVGAPITATAPSFVGVVALP